jgi:hypothetical protein
MSRVGLPKFWGCLYQAHLTVCGGAVPARGAGRGAGAGMKNPPKFWKGLYQGFFRLGGM